MTTRKLRKPRQCPKCGALTLTKKALNRPVLDRAGNLIGRTEVFFPFCFKCNKCFKKG